MMTKRRLTGWVLLALGAVLVSTGIAWGCALWAPMTASRPLSREEVSMILSRRLGAAPFLAITSGVENFGVGWGFILAGDAAAPPPGPTRRTDRPGPVIRGPIATVRPLPVSPQDKFIQIVRAGWPMPCLRGATKGIGGSRSWEGVVEPPRVVSQMGVKPQRLLPLYPQWGGLAVNTAFYSAIFWLAVPGPKLLRRLMRRRRGLCPMCGYDLAHHHHEICPECGTP